ncbi:unnamed protein product [Phaeothamnion confervicola]
MSTTAPAAAVTEPASLSEEAKELLSHLRSHRKLYWDTKGWGAQAAMLCKKCDTAGIYISDVEIKTNEHLLPGAPAASAIAANAAAIVEKAWGAVSAKYPKIAANAAVAKMLEVDLKNYLRTVSYGICADNTEFIRDEVVEKQLELYKMCGVEASVMKYGVDQLKAAAKEHIKSGFDGAAACFDALAQRFA